MGVFLSSIAWGDLDNNGYLDLVISGARSLTAPFNPYSALYLNDGGIFTLHQLLTGVCFSALRLCDLDNDGDLDILITGRNASGTSVSRLYANTGTEANWPPSAPANLAVTENGEYLLFTWDESIDAEQSSVSLSYSIRIGSSACACDITSSSSLPNGVSSLPNLGMLHSITTYLIRKDAFSLGTTYYWSVQAIDNSFSRSSFAPESTFEGTSVDDLIGEIEQYEGIGGPEDAMVKLTIYNGRGQKVKDLANGILWRGHHQLVWDGRDNKNREVGSGVFLLKLETAGQSYTRKMILMK